MRLRLINAIHTCQPPFPLAECVYKFRRISINMTQQQWTLDDVRATFRQCQSLFHALGDPARQEIILLLSANERLNVSQITEQMHLSRPAISHHLKVLKDAGLVALERESRENFYRLLWDEPVGRLKLLLEQAEIACSGEIPPIG